MSPTLEYLQLVAQTALLQYVTLSLRAVYLAMRENIVCVRFCYDGEVSEEDREVLEVVMTEIIAGFPCCDDQKREIEYDYMPIRIDMPKPVPLEKGGVWAYIRDERAMTQCEKSYRRDC